MAASNNDPTMDLMLLFAVVALFAWLGWVFFNEPILEVWRYIRLAEFAPLMLFDARAGHCFDWLRMASPGEAIPPVPVIEAAGQCFGVETLSGVERDRLVNYLNLSAPSLGALGVYSGHYYRWIVLAACVWFFVHIGFLSPRVKFRNRYDLEGFIKVQAKMWPTLSPIVSFKPSKASARILGTPIPSKLPPFAEPLAPEEWLAFHKIPVDKGIPDRERVRRALLHQLGPRWKGRYEDLPLHIQALFAAYALKGVQKRDESDELLGRLALAWSVGKGFRPSAELVAEIKKILKDPDIGGAALKIANAHAWRTTALLGVLKWARHMGGVLASAQFLWLRGVDRELWYAANNLGRRTFHAEGAGAMAHFMAEGLAGKPLPIPRLETAIITINQYLAAHQPAIPEHADGPARPTQKLGSQTT